MKYMLVVLASFLYLVSISQDSTKLKQKKTAKPVMVENLKDSPAYKRDPHLPVFTLLKTDSSHYSNLDIPKSKPTVIVYFSPDCSHCQADAKNMMEKLDSLKDINFIWFSAHELNKIKEFAIKYNMFDLPNMVFGKDEKWAIPSFFKIGFTPYFAVYDKNGLFFTEFRNGLLPKDIIQSVEDANKKLKSN